MSAPTLTALPGGGSLTQHEADEQERRACAAWAAGIVEGLQCLSPFHPRRDEYLEMLADARRAAGRYYTAPTLGPVA